jgi:SAM-dependent methyltransferase
MKNTSLWKPTRIAKNTNTGSFSLNKQVVYPGSLHLCQIQLDAYLPLMKTHLRGRLLECACDRLPYYEVYRPYVDEVICTDWAVTREDNPFVDFFHDLNTPLPLEDSTFDSILMTDALAHIKRPHLLFRELARVLRPGGKILITSTFINWYGEPPYEYMRCSAYALEDMSREAGLDVVHLVPYGGHADVLLDTLNKGMAGRMSNRIFRVLRWILVKTPWYRKNRKKTSDRYPIGFCLVAQKPQS